MNITISPIGDKMNNSYPKYNSEDTTVEYECTISSNQGVIGFYVDALLASLIKSLIDNKNQTESLYEAKIQVLQETIKLINQK